MMGIKKEVKKDYSTPALFCACIALVFIFLVVSLAFRKPSYPSVSYGATASEVEDYAYSLLELDVPGDDTAEYYLEALSYYDSQIAASKDNEQRFNLQLGLASLLGKTGDPTAGIQVLADIDISEIPLDARYYLYSTYAYLYQRSGDEQEATAYLDRISDEGIYDYIAKIDSGEIVPGEFKAIDDDDDVDNEDDEDNGGEAADEDSVRTFDEEIIE